MGWEWVLLLVGVNHLEDKGQETGTPLLPSTPPSWCGIFTTSYYQNIGVLYVSSSGVWYYMLVVGTYSLDC